MVVAGQLPSQRADKIEYEIVANQAGGTYTVSGSYNTSNMVITRTLKSFEARFKRGIKMRNMNADRRF